MSSVKRSCVRICMRKVACMCVVGKSSDTLTDLPVTVHDPMSS